MTYLSKLPHLPVRSPLAPRRLMGVLAAVILLGACGGDDSTSRVDERAQPDDIWAKAATVEPVAIEGTPESHGLPPLDVLQANPAGVAQELFRRTQTSTWTTKWALYRDGKDIGEMLLANIPASQGVPGRLFVTGTIGTNDTQVVRFDILDRGEGPSLCLQQGTKPVICEVELDQLDLSIDFLSIKGMAGLATLLRDALAIPGLTVQYLEIAGEPAACFYFPPVDMSGAAGQSAAASSGVTFSESGSFCLSREGALVQLKFDKLDIIATTYRNSADPAVFELPGEPT